MALVSIQFRKILSRSVVKTSLASLFAFGSLLATYNSYSQDFYSTPNSPSPFTQASLVSSTVQVASPVNWIEPERTTQSTHHLHVLDENQVATMAAEQSVLARLFCQEANNLTTFSKPRRGSSNGLPSRFLGMLSAREAQRSAEQAMRAHFGLHSTLAGLEVIQELIAEIDRAMEIERKAIQNGIPIPDPTKLERLRLQALDQKLELDQKIVALRSQLSMLIPINCACHYTPAPLPQRTQNPDLCEEIRLGVANRCDLLALRLLATEFSEADDEWAPWALGRFTGITPVTPPATSFWLKRVLKSKETQSRLESRKKQLAQAAEMTERKIASEIDVSWHELGSAISRLQVAQDQLQLLRKRVEQLDAMAELGRPMAADRLEAQLAFLSAQGTLIERTNDLHQAYAIHQLNMGRLPSRQGN